MKRVLLFSLMASGLVFGADRATSRENHLSEWDRIALKTSSPKVHLGHRHKDKMARNEDGTMARSGDRVETDKTTINAFVPVGK